MRHIDFAAHLQHIGRAGQLLRNRSDRAHIIGDVLALEAVAARRRLDEQAALEAQGAGQPVDLWLGRHAEFGILGKAKKAAHTRAKLVDFAVIENIAQG